jgi:hypothetical protein
MGSEMRNSLYHLHNTASYDTASHNTALLIFCVCWTGKRYVHGMGSETRNSLYHLHNGREAAVLTTCKHGKNWRDMQDDRYVQDDRYMQDDRYVQDDRYGTGTQRYRPAILDLHEGVTIG